MAINIRYTAYLTDKVGYTKIIERNEKSAEVCDLIKDWCQGIGNRYISLNIIMNDGDFHGEGF